MPQVNKPLRFAIIIPAFNEEHLISLCLESLIHQTLMPSKIIVVDDGSTDKTLEIIQGFLKTSPLIKILSSKVKTSHQPGAKVIKAFKSGLETISIEDYDIICKFDADLEFPANYLEQLNKIFLEHPKVGLCGGVCTILKNENWQIENLTNFDHVRGALKAYRAEAFIHIDGLQSQMGWDTADEFKLHYRAWQIQVDKSLKVKHHRPTASSYQDGYYKKQGKVFYALRYGLLLTTIAALKLALKRSQYSKFRIVLKSYGEAESDNLNYLLSKGEGRFLRRYRWKKIFRKLVP
jgi:glycosyltransferase involved in cell wall biosynthesis